MTADRHDDAEIDQILQRAKVFAVVGASDRPERPSYAVMATLLRTGYTVHPVNPMLAGQQIHGQTVFARLDDVPGPVDVVDIFRRAPDALSVVRDAIRLKDALGISVVWMQLGIVNDVAADEAEAAGLIAVMDRCPAIELSRQSVAGR